MAAAIWLLPGTFDLQTQLHTACTYSIIISSRTRVYGRVNPHIYLRKKMECETHKTEKDGLCIWRRFTYRKSEVFPYSLLPQFFPAAELYFITTFAGKQWPHPGQIHTFLSAHHPRLPKKTLNHLPSNVCCWGRITFIGRLEPEGWRDRQPGSGRACLLLIAAFAFSNTQIPHGECSGRDEGHRLGEKKAAAC